MCIEVLQRAHNRAEAVIVVRIAIRMIEREQPSIRTVIPIAPTNDEWIV